MKYFTPAWHRGDIEDDAAETIQQAYWDFIRQLSPRLPPGVRRLAVETSLHDGLIRCITLDRRNGTLLIHLRCVDLAFGYFDLDLAFKPVELMAVNQDVLMAAANESKTEILYHEIDIAAADRYVLRLLFWPFREVDIHFSELELSHTPRSDRRIEHVVDRFVVTG